METHCLLKSFITISGEKHETLKWFNLESQKSYNVWTATADETIVSFNFDRKGSCVTFLVRQNNENHIHHSIWYYRIGTVQASLKIQDGSQQISKGLIISDKVQPYFSANSNYIVFALVSLEDIKKPNQNVSKTRYLEL